MTLPCNRLVHQSPRGVNGVYATGTILLARMADPPPRSGKADSDPDEARQPLPPAISRSAKRHLFA